MAIHIRPADLVSDREELIGALSRWLTPQADGRRFDWLYRENPHGLARAWIATIGDDRTIVGVAAAFPRRMYLGGREGIGWVLGDFCIHDQFRSLGPALQLYRAYLAEVNSGGMAFFYDFPSANMIAVYKRIGIEPRDRMVRLAKLLRADRKIGEKVKIRPVARGLSVLTNVLLGLWDRGFRHQQKNEYTFSMHEGVCGEEFSVLARQFNARPGVCVERSAEYLNWRYLAHPFRRHEILTARRDTYLSGYVIFTQAGDDATIVDLYGDDDFALLSGLVVKVVRLLRERGVITVSLPILASHPWVVEFERLGFHARESCPVAVFRPTGRQVACSVGDAQPWLLLHGDRES